MGKWVSVHGTEVFTAMQLELKEAATFTTRYSPKYQIQLIAYKAGEADPYEVISIDDVEDRHRWVEIKLGRREGAR